MSDPHPDPQVRPAVEEPQPGPGPAADPDAHVGDPPHHGSRTGFADRPPGYPNAWVWLRAGILRDWRGVLGAFVATWFYLPVALLAAVWGGLLLGGTGLFLGGTRLSDAVPPELRDAPLVGALLDAFLNRSGGLVGGFLFFVAGFLGGILAVLVLPWRDAFDEPANLLTGLAGVVAAAVLTGVLYTLYRVLLEPRLLAVSGARRLSRREAERLRPILHECARRLGLPGVPRLLIEDDPVLTNARAYARHVVVTTSLLTESDEDVAALLSHELVHWRTGDEVTSAFVRGVALPLVLVHAVPTWLMRTFPHPATNFVVFVVFWPVLLTMKYVVLPLHSRDVRAAEYRADAGAVLAGHTRGMRDMLERRKSFESGRSGWDEAVCATHPPSELRLDRLDRLAAAPDPVHADDRAHADDPADAGEPVAPVTAAQLFGPPGGLGTPRSWLVAGVVMLVCCVGTGVLGVAQWALFRPGAVVDSYFEALADHDARAALEQLTPGARAAAGADDLLARMVEAKGYQPPTDVDVRSIDRTGDKAVAKVSFQLAGRRLDAELPLERQESATLGLFHEWRIVAGPATFQLPDGQPGLTVNGVAVPAGGDAGVSVPLLPGAYTVDGRRNALSETPAQPVVVVPGQESVGSAELVPTLTPDARRTAEESVRRYLDGCAAKRVAAPEGCPFRYYNGSTVKKIAWKITEYPTIELTLTGPTTARVATPYDAQGSARATGTTTDYFGGSTPFTDDETFGVSGVLSVVDGTLTFLPGDE
ncbi:M48 family metalloprotease [Micromonospora sp. R77]|uniref:M48 family metalloprotease n=1 Tax=Micromonospora sp. R77 TaxID=2925836 RepID=UPI001F616E23|nr:M48 family metalloprotease [Micromonospora sp. R77]MCI4061718.1 M48 family metalloprotease [Micromonospora sp. R77]